MRPRPSRTVWRRGKTAKATVAGGDYVALATVMLTGGAEGARTGVRRFGEQGVGAVGCLQRVLSLRCCHFYWFYTSEGGPGLNRVCDLTKNLIE